MQARCKVQTMVLEVPGVRFKQWSRRFRGGLVQVRSKVQGRFRRFRGGLVQARCKVQAMVPEVPGWSGAGQL